MQKLDEISLENLKCVSGGNLDGISTLSLYVANRVIQALNTQYQSWLLINPESTAEARYEMIKTLVDQICACLSPSEREAFNKFTTEFSIYWETSLKRLAGLN